MDNKKETLKSIDKVSRIIVKGLGHLTTEQFINKFDSITEKQIEMIGTELDNKGIK